MFLNNYLYFGYAFRVVRVVLRFLVGNSLELLRIDHNRSLEFFICDKSRPSFCFPNQEYLAIFPRLANILNIFFKLRLLLFSNLLKILIDFLSRFLSRITYRLEQLPRRLFVLDLLKYPLHHLNAADYFFLFLLQHITLYCMQLLD
jgi:hypothetical protein